MRRVVLLLLVAVVLLTGCQGKVVVDTNVAKDGSGVVTVSVGLDQRALEILGDAEREIYLDDARAAGWTVSPLTKDDTGMTWIRGTKRFANQAELNTVMAEIGGGTMFRDFTITTKETDSDTTYAVRGVVDLTKGVEQFSDPEIAQTLGDPFGGKRQEIEAQEGKPIVDMVTFDVTATVAEGLTTSVHPSLKDTAPVNIEAITVVQKPPSAIASFGLYVLVAGGAVIVLLGLIGARRRFAHV